MPRKPAHVDSLGRKNPQKRRQENEEQAVRDAAVDVADNLQTLDQRGLLALLWVV